MRIEALAVPSDETVAGLRDRLGIPRASRLLLTCHRGGGKGGKGKALTPVMSYCLGSLLTQYALSSSRGGGGGGGGGARGASPAAAAEDGT